MDGRMKMSYFTIKDEATAEFKEKKSIFIGHARRVESEDEAKDLTQEIFIKLFIKLSMYITI